MAVTVPRGLPSLREVPGFAFAAALPDEWEAMWGSPSPTYRRQLLAFKAEFEALASSVLIEDGETTYQDLVHPSSNRVVPLHRWFTYKEAFSADLPRQLIRAFGAGSGGVVVDSFAGVATTQLSLETHPQVSAAYGIEWSPLAHLVGRAKVAWSSLDVDDVASKVEAVLRFDRRKRGAVPELAAFRNAEIFDVGTVNDLVLVRRKILDVAAPSPVRDFLLVGLAAIVEDSSSVMKDGRALRIMRDRAKRPTSLAPEAKSVRERLRIQYREMLADLRSRREGAGDRHPVGHFRGDARDLDRALAGTVVAGDVGLFAYSPPYLNCIDYTEVYKLEAWLLELIKDQEEFRNTRLGTLRSHPSIEFPPQPFLEELFGRRHNLSFLLRGLSTFLERHHAGSGIGKMVANYFDDMSKVLAEQLRYLEPGGHAVCVVANSTFSRRDKIGTSWRERWRLPILTDVILSRIALDLGFSDAYIIRARDLRPRNVTGGVARESLVVARK